MSFLPLQAQPFYLAGAGALAGDITITLKSFAQIDGTLITMSDLGTIAYLTLEPGNNAFEEQASFTGVTQNSNGTATLTGIKHVTFDSPYTETSGLNQSHAGSSVVVLSNTSGYYNQFPAKQNTETITGYWAVPDPVGMTDIANKQYVLSVVNGGSVSTNALIEVGTAGETLVAGNLVYLKSTDARWWKCDADTASTVDNVQLGIAQGAGTAGNPITGGVLRRGLDSNQSGGAVGLAYASNTAGGITTSTGTTERVVGEFLSATSIIFDPFFYYTLTATQKSAISSLSPVGSFAGTGSDGALSISSGTTTINLAGAAVVVKNYTSISITGTGNLAFSNPNAAGTVVVLKSQGAITLTSSSSSVIDMRGIGAAGGAAGTGGSSPTNGGAGTDSVNWLGLSGKGGGGVAGGNGSGGTGGTAGAISSPVVNQTSIASSTIQFLCGAGGGGGGGARPNGGTAADGGAGGSGGGGLIIQCGGAFNFTTGTITAAGAVGSNASAGSGNRAGSGGGGGGGGGSVVIIYNTLTANSGTITKTGGAAGNGEAGSTPGTERGGGGGGGGGSTTAGTVGSGESGGSGGNGGAGGNGFSLVTANTAFL